MAVSAKVGQFSDVEIQPKDRKGNPARVENVKFTSTNEDVVKVVSNTENALKVRLLYVGLGVAQVDVSADADLDEDETRLITDFIGVEVKEEEAVGLGFVVSEPADLPAEGTGEATPENGASEVAQG